MKITENFMLNNVRRISFFLIIFCILLIPTGNILRITFSRQVSILLIDAILGFQSLLTIFLVLSSPKVLKKKPVAAVFLFLAVCLGSLAVNASKFDFLELAVSSAYLLRFVLYAQVILLGYFFSQVQKEMTVKMLILSGFLYSLIGIGQYFLYPDIRNLRYLGWDEHLYRLTGTFFDPNFSGAFIVGIFFLTLLHYKNFIARMYPTVVLGITFISMILTYSRSTYLAFIVGIVTLAFFRKSRIFLVGSIIIFFISFLFLPKNLTGEGVNLFRTASISARIKEYKKAFQFISEVPLFGHGFNTLRYVQSDKGFLVDDEAFNSHSAAGIPNSILFILVTTGIAGLSAYFIMYRSFLVAAKTSDINHYQGLITISIVLFTHSMFENTLFYPFILLFFFVYVATSLKGV